MSETIDIQPVDQLNEQEVTQEVVDVVHDEVSPVNDDRTKQDAEKPADVRRLLPDDKKVDTVVHLLPDDKKSLKEKVACPDCGKTVSLHALKYTHKCKTKKSTVVAEPVIEPVIEPVSEPVIEPVAEPVIEPVAEPVTEPEKEEPQKEKPTKKVPVKKNISKSKSTTNTKNENNNNDEKINELVTETIQPINDTTVVVDNKVNNIDQLVELLKKDQQVKTQRRQQRFKSLASQAFN